MNNNLNKLEDYSNKITNYTKKSIVVSWNFKNTLVWSGISILFIIINVIFFLLAIGFRDTNCINNTSFDLSEWLLVSTGLGIVLLISTWLVNYIGGQGFWLSLFNIGYHIFYICILVLLSIGGIILISFSKDKCANKPEPLFIIVPLYILLHNMIGGVFIAFYCGLLGLDSIKQYYERNTLLDNLII